jgi:hypothetical protein
MPQLDQDPLDPAIAAMLDAIDATLAGEPVDGRYAEVAEIALLLASDRPPVPPAFAQSMDQRVERRFAPLGRKPRRFGPAAQDKQRRWPGAWQAMGALATGVALIVAIAVVASGNGASSASSSSASAGVPSAASSSSGSARGGSAATAAPGAAHTRAVNPAGSAGRAALVPPTVGGAGTSTVSSGASSSTSSAASSASSAPSSASSAPSSTRSAPSSASSPNGAAQPLQPPTTGRKVVLSAQLSLAAAPSKVDDVAQQIYDVVGAENGIVNSSTVTQTSGTDGYAEFQLSVPSASLGQTMTRLSTLNNAQVVSRTDSSQDITDQYGAATRALDDARALRTSLLKQLAAATTTAEINSLTAQIHDAEASISSDQATLNRLNHQVNYSELYVTIQAQNAPPPVSHGGGGFTIGRAAHDAGHVLTVVAGVALIAIAALTPVALVAALVWWVGSTLKRRRREQALDSV